MGIKFLGEREAIAATRLVFCSGLSFEVSAVSCAKSVHVGHLKLERDHIDVT